MPRGIPKAVWNKMSGSEREQWLKGRKRTKQQKRERENVIPISFSPRKPPARVESLPDEEREESPFVIAVLETAKRDIDAALERFSRRRAA